MNYEMRKNAETGSLKHLIEMLKALFGGNPNKPRVNTVNVKKQDLENLAHNINYAKKQMVERSKEMSEKGEHFKALVLETRAEQMESVIETINDHEKNGLRLDYFEMASVFNQKLESKLDKIKDTDLFNKAQSDFVRFQLKPDDMLKIDKDIIDNSFSQRNPAEAAFMRYMNSATEEFCKGNVREINSSAKENGLNVSHQKTFGRDGLPAYTPTSVKDAQEERARKKKPDNIPLSPNEDPSGFESESIMPPKKDDDHAPGF